MSAAEDRLWVYLAFDKKVKEMKKEIPAANAKEKAIAREAKQRGVEGRG